MSLKDQIAADIGGTFLNQSEFADEHTIDGVVVTAIIDTDSIDDNPLPYAEGVSVVRQRLYVDPIELGYTPVQDQNMTIDGDVYQVVRVGNEAGLLAIDLERNVG